MPQPLGDQRLAADVGTDPLVTGQRGREQLDRHGTAAVRVDGVVDRGDAATADRAEQDVPPEDGRTHPHPRHDPALFRTA
jgi:hypothetical protein